MFEEFRDRKQQQPVSARGGQTGKPSGKWMKSELLNRRALAEVCIWC